MNIRTLPKVSITLIIWLIAFGLILSFSGGDTAVTQAVIAGANPAGIIPPTPPGMLASASDPLGMILPLLLAVLATAFIWFSMNNVQNEAYEKPKRTASKAVSKEEARLNVLLSMMDDEERDAFKETLKRQVLSNMRLSDEGELPVALSSLLDEEPYKQKR